MTTGFVVSACPVASHPPTGLDRSLTPQVHKRQFQVSGESSRLPRMHVGSLSSRLRSLTGAGYLISSWARDKFVSTGTIVTPLRVTLTQQSTHSQRACGGSPVVIRISWHIMTTDTVAVAKFAFLTLECDYHLPLRYQ
jgi:hypothetical protein